MIDTTPDPDGVKIFTRETFPESTNPDSVTICGFGPSSYGINYHPSMGEVWSINSAWDHYTNMKFARIIDIHKMTPTYRGKKMIDTGNANRIAFDGRTFKDHWIELDKEGTIITLQEDPDYLENSERYPIEDAYKLAGCCTPLQGSPHYAIALAIQKGFKTIHLYGLDLNDFEHKSQTPYYLYWLGIAVGRGINIKGYVPQLLPAPIYGYNLATEDEYKEWLAWKQWSGIWGWRFLRFQARNNHKIARDVVKVLIWLWEKFGVDVKRKVYKMRMKNEPVIIPKEDMP